MSTENTTNEFVLKNVRLSYPNLFKAKSFPGAEESSAKFSASFILDKKEHAAIIKDLTAAINGLIKTELKLPKLPSDKVALRDGESKGDKEGYGDNVMFVSASNTRKPRVIDRDKSDIDEKDARIYGGIYVNAIIRLWVQSNNYGKRINASLEAVQYVCKGEAFGSAPVDVDTAFEDLPEDEEADMLA